MRAQESAKLTIEAIAAEAGVGKQTIYRWWPSKGAVVAEAVLEETLPRVRFTPTGDFERDPAEFFEWVKFRSHLSRGVTVGTMLIPFPVLMAPLFMLYAKLGWIGTFLPLYAQFWLGNAFSIFLLHQFFKSLPKELDEAASIDGCSHWQTFRHIALPLSRNALAVVVLLHFTYMWNDFLAPLVFIVDREKFTLMLGLQLYQSKAGQTPWNLLMAASTMTVLPVLVVFVLTNRLFTRSSLSGAVKG